MPSWPFRVLVHCFPARQNSENREITQYSTLVLRNCHVQGKGAWESGYYSKKNDINVYNHLDVNKKISVRESNK